MTEIDILIKNLKPPVFRFIIIKSIQTEQAISLVKKKIKENLPNKKNIFLKTEGKNYRELMDFVYANAKNIILIQDFDKLANNKDVSIGFNQRRDKLADLNLAILAFVPDNNGVQDIMNNLPDLWSFRSSIIEFEFEPLQEKKKAEKTGELDSDITYIEHNTAKKEYKTIIKRIKDLDIIDENLPLLNASYIRLFDTCYSLGRYKEGLDFTKKLYDIAVKFDYEEKIPALYSDILDWLGKFYYELGEYNKAINYFEKALNINIKAFGEKHPNTAKSLNNIGIAWRALGEYKKAINYYNKALNINIKVFGEEHPDTAKNFNSLGVALRALGEYEKAINYYNKALNINIKVFGEEHPDTAKSLNNIGIALRVLGEYEKAINYYNKAETIYIKFLGKKHPNTKLVRNNIKNCKKNNYEKRCPKFFA